MERKRADVHSGATLPLHRNCAKEMILSYSTAPPQHNAGKQSRHLKPKPFPSVQALAEAAFTIDGAMKNGHREQSDHR